MADSEYRLFQSKLIPNIDSSKIIGVRTPTLRKLAKELSFDDAAVFMQSLPHCYYEENNLHGFLIERIRDYDECICRLESFLPYVDNWATCDGTSPKALADCPEKLFEKLKVWLASSHTYTVRFAILTLMRHWLDERFSDEIPQIVAAVKSDEYYVMMMKAWFFATALSKQYNAILPILETRTLDVKTHNMAIKKALESFRITPEQKVYLKSLKISNFK